MTYQKGNSVYRLTYISAYTDRIPVYPGSNSDTCQRTMSSIPVYAHLLPPSWKTQVGAWLAEDAPSFDYGGFVVGEAEREAFLFGKGSQRAVLAGVPFFTEVFEQLGCK